MSKTAAFPKILHVGDKQIADLFDGEVEITEKVDGSQFGFGKVNGELFVRSKGKEQDLDTPDKMFTEGVAYVKSIADKIPDNMCFYGEYLQKPRHSTLAYERIPKNHIALFGACNSSTREYFSMPYVKAFAEMFEVDAIPVLKVGISSPEEVLEMVKGTKSYLGGQDIEGVVVKAYKPWMFLGQIPLSVMSGKYVSEAFKEVHQRDWTKLNTSGGKLGVLKSNYRSEARWNKAIQRLKETGLLTGTPRDIGALIKESISDLRSEEEQNIKDKLWEVFGKDILSESVNGLPQWYKEKIIVGEFHETEDTHGMQLHTMQKGQGQVDSENVSPDDAPVLQEADKG